MPDLSDARRMAAAVELSGDRPGEDAAQIRRRGTQRAIVVRVILMVVALAGGAVIGVAMVTSRPRRELREAVPAWQEHLGLGCSIVGVCLTFGTIIWMARTRRIRSGWTSPAFALTWRQRRDLRRQVAGRQPVDPAQVAVLRRLSRETIRQQPEVWLILGVLLSTLGSTLTSQLPGRWALLAVVAGLFGFALVSQRRALRHARTFLATHPGPAPAAADA